VRRHRQLADFLRNATYNNALNADWFENGNGPSRVPQRGTFPPRHTDRMAPKPSGNHILHYRGDQNQLLSTTQAVVINGQKRQPDFDATGRFTTLCMARGMTP